MNDDRNASQVLADLVAGAATDAGLRQALLADPRKVLADAGLRLPPEMAVVTRENTPGRMHLVLPPAAAGEALDDEQLAAVSGAGRPSRHAS
jgi:hypothetical protein